MFIQNTGWVEEGGVPPPPSTTIPVAIGRVGPETHVNKNTNVPVFYIALGLNYLKISTFVGPNGTRFARCYFRA
jgi:hypothetical protein